MESSSGTPRGFRLRIVRVLIFVAAVLSVVFLLMLPSACFAWSWAQGPWITGTVFADTNGNGIQDPGEAGLNGVTITCIPAAGSGSTVVTYYAGGTGLDGQFAFATDPGDYDLVITSGEGYAMTVRSVTVTAGMATVTFPLGEAVPPEGDAAADLQAISVVLLFAITTLLVALVVIGR